MKTARALGVAIAPVLLRRADQIIEQEVAMKLIRIAGLIALALQVTVGVAIGQTFVFGAQGEPVQLDPAVITDGISGRITRQIYDGLVKYKGATTEVEPTLAQSWEVSPDGKAWTFTLRHNVKFHDGTPFDAKAGVWNFERWGKSSHPTA